MQPLKHLYNVWIFTISLSLRSNPLCHSGSITQASCSYSGSIDIKKSSDSLRYSFITGLWNPVYIYIYGLTTFQVLDSHTWLPATMLNSTVLEFAVNEITNQISGSWEKLHKCIKMVLKSRFPGILEEWKCWENTSDSHLFGWLFS